MGLYPCVDTSSWVERLVGAGVKDIQLRIKVSHQPDGKRSHTCMLASCDAKFVVPVVMHRQNKPMEDIDAEVRRAQDACTRCGARLWVNDYWELAVKHR
eukprot:36970-Eustigmatos_ZCMA.PRE.1